MTLRKGPWTIVFDDINSKFSGRYTIWCLSFMLLTMMHTTHFYLGRSWIGRHLVDFNDHNARIGVHRWLGISLCIVTILHVSSMLLPVMFSGYDLIVNPGYFVLPLSEAAPEGFKQADTDAKLMMMQVDDVYRLILIYVLLGPIVFLSVQWMSSNYRFGIRLHQFVMIMYVIDICRRHSHPHCWVYNIPCFIAWIVDLAWGHFYLHQRIPVKRIMISENYMFLYFKSLVPVSGNSIGNYYHLRCSCSMCNWERSHPFTHMNKRGVMMSDWTSILHSHDKFYLNHGEDLKMSEPEEWNKGILVRTYKGALAHTRMMREVPELEMDLWGSFSIDNIAHYVDSEDDVILVGGGSGSIFLLDCLTYLVSIAKSIDKKWLSTSAKNKTEEPIWCLTSPELYHPNITPRISQLLFKTSTAGHIVGMQPGDPNDQNNIKKSIGIIMTSNDPELVQFFINVVDDIMTKNIMPKCIDLNITIAMTKKMTDNYDKQFSVKSISWGKIKLGRVDFFEEIQKMTENNRKCHLFCQGGPALQSAVRAASKEAGHTYHEAHSFDSGPASFGVKCGCTAALA